MAGTRSGLVAPHAHSHKREAFYLLSGQLELHTPTQRERLAPGELLILGPGEWHQIVNPGPESAEYLIFAEEIAEDQVQF